ncbi:MAG TPA: hypothetical protein VH744_13440, partial [Terriglobales bacterium]
AAPSGVLEEVMRAVAQGSSEAVLRLADKLLTEGHNPVHFARQLVRFLRNAMVAKVAGGDSGLLQISSDERRRVTRVAELFSEEDLARHLQIMLRTHGELGYRQEQRFHLELGLVKMAHAQRLLPIEQLLSDVVSLAAPRPPGKPIAVPDARKPEAGSQDRSSFLSPFAADTARKSGSKPQLLSDNAPAANTRAPVVMGAAAPAPVAEVEKDSLESAPSMRSFPDALRQAVLKALSGAGHHMLVSMLESGEWKLEGNDLSVRVASSATVIDMLVGAEAKKLVTATAGGVVGRPVKFKVIPGASPEAVVPRPASNGGGRSRVEQDPIVRRMKEKFGAEIRTIIDYKERR